MAQATNIEWAQHSWNPVIGCSRVSEGCRRCYAERMAATRLAKSRPNTYGLVVQGQHWNNRVLCLPDKLEEPLRRRTPTVYFVNSMSDLFHPDVPFDFIDQVFAAMALAQQHTFIVLTKRPERMAQYCLILKTGDLPPDVPRGYVAEHGVATACVAAEHGGSLPNVILGTSVENQATLDERLPHLLRTPAACRMLSVEPMLGPIDLTCVRCPTRFPGCMYTDALRGRDVHEDDDCNATETEKVDWVVCGGESGPGARALNPEWVRSLRDQCVAAGVPFFFKQWGEWWPRPLPFRSQQHWVDKARTWMDKGDTCIDLDGRVLEMGRDFEMAHYPVAIMVPLGKRAAGRKLDGRTWDEYPELLRQRRAVPSGLTEAAGVCSQPPDATE